MLLHSACLGYAGIEALHMVRNLPVLGRRPGHLVRAESNPRLRLRRPSSADCTGRYAGWYGKHVSARGRTWALLKDLSRLARVDSGLKYCLNLTLVSSPALKS
jgi:hypothetical protein